MVTTVTTTRHALSIGWHPDVPNPMTPAEVREGLAAAQAKVAAAGHVLELCLLGDEPADLERIESALRDRRHDAIVVGAGIRLQPKHHLLFERIVNLVHRAAPQAAICFNTTPVDTADAVLRWISGETK
jgi:hypothetical protein